jgi:putative phage-type endonuclease
VKVGQKVTPTGILVAPYSIPREQWLELRRQGIGGSDALAVTGLDKWTPRMRVYLDKTGQLPEREPTDAMLWGSMVESDIAHWFTARTGIRARKCGLLRHTERPWQQVSVDRLTADAGILEIKNTNHWRRHEWENDQVADGAEAQGQHALAVTGLSHAWFAAQIGGQPPEFRRIERDERFIANLTAIEEEFWQLVLARTPPALDGGERAAELVAQIYPSADPGVQAEVGEEGVAVLREYAAAHADELAAKQRKETAKARITALIGAGEVAAFEGEVVATWSNRKKVSCDHARLRAEWPEVAAKVLTEKMYRQFASKLREEMPDEQLARTASRAA